MVTLKAHHIFEERFARLDRFIDPLDLGPEERSKRLLTTFVSIVTVPVLFVYAGILFFMANYVLSVFLLVLGSGITTSLFIGRKRENVTNLYRINLAFVGLLFLYLIFTSGTIPRRLFWAYLFPLEAFYLLGRKEGLFYNLVYYVLAVPLLFIQELFNERIYFDLNNKIEFLLSLLIVTMISYFFESVRLKYQEGMGKRQMDLEKANLNLKHEIAKRAQMEKTAVSALKVLKKTQAQLIQSGKLASIGQMASGVAHELNQPLLVIRSNAQILHRKLRKGELLPSENLVQFELIERNTKRMMNIINHVRIFSRQSKGEFSRVAVNTILEDCFLMVSEQLRLHNIEVKKNLDERLPNVIGDHNQLEQVFLNLITNARDAVDSVRIDQDGSGTIEIKTRVSKNDKQCIEVLIKDNGPGIPKENVKKIFDPFFTTKEVGQGTGLGLSISYGIIKDHKGTIEVLETGPVGTTFRIELPITTAPGKEEKGVI